jgi:hypothetical protein
MKTFTNDLRDQFYNPNVFAVDLCEFHLTTPVYVCSGGYDISIDTATAPNAGVNVYSAQGEFMSFTTIAEDVEVKIGKLSITMSGLTALTEQFIDPNNSGKRVVIYRCFLDLNTGQPVSTTGNPYLVFDGQINNVAVVEGDRTCTLSVDCASLFADFERSAGRKTNNDSNWYFQGVKYDTCFEQSGILKNTELLWGRTQ